MARTNRPYRNKAHGLIVDYVGVYRDMRRALNDYEREHLRVVIGGDEPPAQTVWQGFNESAVPHLQAQHQRVMALLDELGLTHLNTPAAKEYLLNQLWDLQLRARFDERVRDFLSALNAVLPRPQGLRYVKFAKQVGEVQYRARSRYLDDRPEFSPRRYGAKVRALIDEHLVLRGIEQKIPPRDITADDYLEKLDNLYDDRARALDMASALRSRIDLQLPTAVDRNRYERLSERLDRITRSMEEDFNQAADDLLDLVTEEQDLSAANLQEGLAYFTEQPVRFLLEQSLSRTDRGAVGNGIDIAVAVRGILVCLTDLAGHPNFPGNRVVRQRGVKTMIRHLERELNLYDAEPEALATELVDLAARRVHDFRRWRVGDDA
jgi:type I restriction enzyme R subunit